MQPVETPLDLSSAVTQFWNAHDEALFSQPILPAITGLSAAYFERARWEGDGPKYFKLGRLVRYKKKDVLAWLEKNPAVSSTTEAAEKIGPQFGAPRGPRKKREQPRGDVKQKARATPKVKSARRHVAQEGPRQEQVEG